jgi:hypothetical protein
MLIIFEDLVENGILSLEYCPTEQQETDIFTKSLIEEKVCASSSLLGMREVVIKGEH